MADEAVEHGQEASADRGLTLDESGLGSSSSSTAQGRVTAPPPFAAGANLRRAEFLGLVLCDAGCLGVALAVWYLLEPAPGASEPYILFALLAIVTWIVLFAAFGLYNPSHLPGGEECLRVVGAAGLGVGILTIAAVPRLHDASSVSLLFSGLTLLGTELSVRLAWRAHRENQRVTGRSALRAVVLGPDGEADALLEALGVKGTGFEPIGVIRTSLEPEPFCGSRALCSIGELEYVIRAEDVDCLFVAATGVGASDIAQASRIARQLGLDFRFETHLPSVLPTRIRAIPIRGSTLMSMDVRPIHLRRAQAVVKRAVDLVVGSLALIVSLPILLSAAAAIKLTSPGPVLFRQERDTKGGAAFRMLKLRTMVIDGDGLLTSQGIDTSAPFFKLDNDPRLTRVGRIIRRLSIDELPQLVNVIVGDMSLVGPRPLPIDQVAANPGLLEPRHEVRTGMTGWWQVNGRSDNPAKEAMAQDVFYIENWSLGLDLWILLRTIGSVLRGRGAK